MERDIGVLVVDVSMVMRRLLVDVLMESAAMHYGPICIGAPPKGMGKDGAPNMKAMMDRGRLTIARDEDTSVIYGMPRAEMEDQAANRVVPPSDVGESLIQAMEN